MLFIFASSASLQETTVALSQNWSASIEVARSSGSINESLRSIEDRVTEYIKQTQKMLRNVAVYSGGGFALATALVFYFLKK
ncbi:unnamed protein product [Brassica oleracea]